MVKMIIKDRILNLKVDWFEVEENEVEKMLEEIKTTKDSKNNLYYSNCDVYVDGVVKMSF